MFDFYYAVTHHLELIQVTQAEYVARIARLGRPGLKDHIYLRLGDFLITMGSRLHKASLLGCKIPIPQEAVISDLLQEVS